MQSMQIDANWRTSEIELWLKWRRARLCSSHVAHFALQPLLIQCFIQGAYQKAVVLLFNCCFSHQATELVDVKMQA